MASASRYGRTVIFWLSVLLGAVSTSTAFQFSQVISTEPGVTQLQLETPIQQQNVSNRHTVTHRGCFPSSLTHSSEVFCVNISVSRRTHVDLPLVPFSLFHRLGIPLDGDAAPNALCGVVDTQFTNGTACATGQAHWDCPPGPDRVAAVCCLDSPSRGNGFFCAKRDCSGRLFAAEPSLSSRLRFEFNVSVNISRKMAGNGSSSTSMPEVLLHTHTIHLSTRLGATGVSYEPPTEPFDSQPSGTLGSSSRVEATFLIPQPAPDSLVPLLSRDFVVAVRHANESVAQPSASLISREELLSSNSVWSAAVDPEFNSKSEEFTSSWCRAPKWEMPRAWRVPSPSSVTKPSSQQEWWRMHRSHQFDALFEEPSQGRNEGLGAYPRGRSLVNYLPDAHQLEVPAANTSTARITAPPAVAEILAPLMTARLSVFLFEMINAPST